MNNRTISSTIVVCLGFTLLVICYFNFRLVKYAKFNSFKMINDSGSVIIDNEVENQPRVYCFQNGLKLQVETKNPFTGHIYVKGMYGNVQCNRNFTGESKQPALNIAYAECIHNREPLSPGGMMFTLEVIVQFHPYFTTKIDRAFIVSCSYREAENIVTQNQILQGNVMLPDGSSDSIPVTRVSYSPLMPNCQYTIHRGAPDGPLISFARVGEKVVHRWQCLPTADGEFHGILVHDCFARDVRGTNRIHILDKRGCTLDPFSLPTPTYTLDLTMAYAAVHAFKFADDLQISFACSISLCLRMNDGCVGTSPPQCEGSQTTTSASGIGGSSGSKVTGDLGSNNPYGGAGSNSGAPPSSVPKPPGYSFAFQRSDASDSVYFPDIFGNFSDFVNSSVVSLPYPPPANVLMEPEAKPRKSELLIDTEVSFVHDGRNLHTMNSSLISSETDFELSLIDTLSGVNNKTTTGSAGTSVPLAIININPSPAVIERQTETATPAATIININPTIVTTPFQPPLETSRTVATTNMPTTPMKISVAKSLVPTTVADNDFPIAQPLQSNFTTGSTTEINLGVFVGEGYINNPQPVIHTVTSNYEKRYAVTAIRYYPPGFKVPKSSSSSQDDASFAGSKQKDTNPVVHIRRLIPGKFVKHHVRQHVGSTTTTAAPTFDYDDNFLEGPIDVTAQDFVVFDRRSISGVGNETWNEDELVKRVQRNICITTFAFTQIVIAITIVFSCLVAVAVYLHMRHRKKVSISDLHY